jgi:hypothetical protein
MVECRSELNLNLGLLAQIGHLHLLSVTGPKGDRRE